METFADKVLAFYKTLVIHTKLPAGIEVLDAYQDDIVFNYCTCFYKKYYNDRHQRIAILGINPGRFGAGLTGIPFTDPVKLENMYGIKNDLPKKTELSADFIHTMIRAFGGYEKFYSKYFINSVCPLGFVQNGKNLNYYDTPALRQAVEEFILTSLHRLLELGISREVAYCLGEGQNYKYLARLNEKEKIFGRIIPMAHPRFIMQYKRKHTGEYVEDYLKKFKEIQHYS